MLVKFYIKISERFKILSELRSLFNIYNARTILLLLSMILKKLTFATFFYIKIFYLNVQIFEMQYFILKEKKWYFYQAVDKI